MITSVILNVLSKYVKSYEILIVSRLVSGIYYGLYYGLCPLYLNELPPVKYRGLFGTFAEVFGVLGIVVTNVLGLPEVLGTEDRWPILVGFPLIPMIANVFLFFGAESPKYLYIKKNQPEEAERLLLKLRGDTNVELVKLELKTLETEKISIYNQISIGWLDLVLKPQLRHSMLISIGIMTFQELSGINSVTFYFYLKFYFLTNTKKIAIYHHFEGLFLFN